MKAHLFIIRFLVFILFCTNLLAQSGTIDNLRIIPGIPVNFDTVKVEASVTFSSGDCVLDHYQINISSHDIRIYAFYKVGMLTYICHDTKVFSLGILNPGNYYVTYYLKNAESNSTYSTKTTSFYVSTLPQTPDVSQSDNGVLVYPNPFNSSATISLDKTIEEKAPDIYLLNIYGQVVRKIDYSGNSANLAREGLARGLYFISIKNDNRVFATEKIIIEE